MRGGYLHQRHTESQRGPVVEVGLDELGPLLGNLARELGVAVARQVGEDDLRLRLSGPAHFEEIDAAGASGCGAGARDLIADQRIDHAGFAYVRAAEEGDFREAGSGKVGGISGRREKSRDNPHALVCYASVEVGKRWNAAIQPLRNCLLNVSA